MGYGVAYQVVDEVALRPFLSQRGGDLARRHPAPWMLDEFQDPAHTLRDLLALNHGSALFDFHSVTFDIGPLRRQCAYAGGGIEDNLVVMGTAAEAHRRGHLSLAIGWERKKGAGYEEVGFRKFRIAQTLRGMARRAAKFERPLAYWFWC